MPQFLHDNGEAKATAIPRVFSENSRADKPDNLRMLLKSVIPSPDVHDHGFFF